jgi:hypothetical protein
LTYHKDILIIQKVEETRKRLEASDFKQIMYCEQQATGKQEMGQGGS